MNFLKCNIYLCLSIFLSACGGGSGGGESNTELYQPAKVIADSIGIAASAVADFNQDGFDDIVAARSTGPATGDAAEILILINDKNGSLSDQTSMMIDGTIPSTFFARDIHVGDFNGDSIPDVFFSNHGKEPLSGPSTFPCEQNTLLISQSNGKLKDVTSTNLPIRVDFSHGSSIADFDSDGDLDIWVNNLPCSTSRTSYLLKNDGNGVFTDAASANDGSGIDGTVANPNGILPIGFNGAYWSQSIDVNLDGSDDLFYTGLSDAGLLLNDGSGTFSIIDNENIPDGPITKATQDVNVADLNNDGLDDLVLFQTPVDFSAGWSLQVLINNGNNGFTDETDNLLPPQNSIGGGGPRVWLEDINGDNYIDIMVWLYSPDFAPDKDVTDFYLNDGMGKFTELSENQLPSIRPEFTPIDVNNDGKLDFVFPAVLNAADGGVLMLTIAN